MTTRQRTSVGAAIVVVLALLSCLSVSPGTPQVYAPLNLVVLVPAFWADELVRGAFIYVAVAVVPLCFCLWCWSVLGGSVTLPARSVVLLVVAVALSAFSLIFGAHYGIEYQSVGYVVGVATINVICWVLLGGLAFLARRRPSFGHNLGFHAALFAWLAWCAFPYLGELP